jgi:hypothetical protein
MERAMDRRTMIVWIAAFVAVAGVVGFMALASMQNAKAKADASVAKAQEHTKRAEGRHQLVDFLGLIRRQQ